jgi:hypothetical protein
MRNLVPATIVPDPSQNTFPERATVALGNKRDRAYLMLDVVMLALGLGFLLVAVVMRTPAKASEENENVFRLFTRGPRRCWLAVLLALCPAAA